MTVEVMSWVLNEAPGLPAHAFGVLMGLANHADKYGRGAYPSQKTLADYARKSVRQVRRDLDDLKAAGLIREGDARLVAHLPADSRPLVWDLAIELVRSDMKATGRTRPVVDDRADVHDRADTDVRSKSETADQNASNDERDRTSTSGRTPTTGRTSTSDKPSFSSSSKKRSNTSTSKPRGKAAADAHPRFAEFWAAYPLKAGVADARKAFTNAIEAGADPDVLIAAAGRYARHCQRTNKDRHYIKHGSGWLNGERWADEYDGEPTDDTPETPPWCGHCNPDDRWRERSDGRLERCPECHPIERKYP